MQLLAELRCEAVEGEGAEQVAAHAGFYGAQAAGGGFDPVEGYRRGHSGQLFLEIDVADEVRGFGFEEEQVFEEGGSGANEGFGFFLAFGAGAVGFGDVEEVGCVGLAASAAQEDEGVGAAGEVRGEIEVESAADGAFGEAGDEGALGGAVGGAAFGEELLDLAGGDGAEAEDAGAGADGGEEFAGVFCEQDDGGVVGWFFEDFEEGVGGFLHEGGAGEDGEGTAGFGGDAVDFAGQDADLADFDEELRRVGGNDEDVGVGLDEDAGVALVGVAHVFAGGDGFGYAGVEVAGLADAGAVGTDAAEVGEAVGVCWCEAVGGLGEHDGEGVFAGAAGSGEDERMREALGGDGFAQVADGGFVAEEVAEGHVIRVQRGGRSELAS